MTKQEAKQERWIDYILDMWQDWTQPSELDFLDWNEYDLEASR